MSMNTERLERFLYWFQERHLIHLRRQAGQAKPWTEDEQMLDFFFTNPYRENDKTTVWFRTNIRDPLRANPAVLMATIIFRWFNFIPTGQVLLLNDREFLKQGLAIVKDKKGAKDDNITPHLANPSELLHGSLYVNWDPTQCRLLLKPRGKIVTGAFVINTASAAIKYGIKTKLDGVIHNIDDAWAKRDVLLQKIQDGGTLESAWKTLNGKVEGIGPFMAYEAVSDLRWTYLLENAPDILTWANPGPGARRGLNRLFDRSVDWNLNTDRLIARNQFIKEMRQLLDTVRHRISRDGFPFRNETPYSNDSHPEGAPFYSWVHTEKHSTTTFSSIFPTVEMREIEHSLCEFDKYERARASDGKMKRKYRGRR